MIEAHALTKRYGPVTAVDQLSFDVRPGVVTGFLGPNGSGKSTTMRLILGLDTADHGTVTVAGHGYHDLRYPLREVGALHEGRAQTEVGEHDHQAREHDHHAGQAVLDPVGSL